MGPFVVMIYEMILVDVLRFVLIYVIFLIGFSQGAVYCIHCLGLWLPCYVCSRLCSFPFFVER